MSWQFTSFMIPLVASALTSATLAIFAWRRRPGPGVGPLVILLITVSAWSVMYILELGAARLPDKVFWINMQYFCITAIPPIWLVFVLAYTRHERWLTRRYLLPLLIEPLLVIALVWTNDQHGLFRSNIALHTGTAYPIVTSDLGIGFWTHAVYSYALLLAGTALLLRTMIRAPQLYRGQTFALLLGTVAPWLGNAIYIFTDFPLDLTPMAFTITGLALTWALFRLRLLDIVPIARDVVIENLRDSVIVLDLQGRIVDLNPAAWAMLGEATRPLIGRPLPQALPDVAEHLAPAGQARAEMTIGEGSRRSDLELHISPLSDRRGQVIGHVIVLHDITHIRQADQALRDSEGRYRSLLEATFESIIIHQEGRVVDVNQAFERMFGYSREAIIGQSALLLVAEESRDLVQRHLLAGVEEPYEAIGLRQDGTTFSSEIRAKRLVYQGRQAHVAAVRDITDRKQAEASLQRRLRETLLLNRVIATATSLPDTHLILETTCEELARAFKLPQAAIGLLDDDGQHLTIVAEYLSPGRPSIAGLAIPVADNRAIRTVIEQGVPLYLSDMPTDDRLSHALREEARRRGAGSLLLVPLLVGERVIGTLGLDATGLRAFTPEEITLAQNVAATAGQALERARLYETLQQELAERRRAQENLRQANIQLAEANQLKSHFLANMSHELRTPLNSILGYAEMLAQGTYGPLNDKQLDRLEKISRNGQTLLGLINDILDLSRIEAGRMELELEPTPIAPMIAACLAGMEPLAERKGLQLRQELRPVPPLLVDRGRLSQVLNNLVGNAIKFTPSGRVLVQARPLEDGDTASAPPALAADRRWGLIVVEDTGIGIAPQDWEVIFDEFRQVDGSYTRQYEGTGLGLAITRRLVEMMGGHIWLESTPGQGSKFFVALPVAEETA